MDSSDWERRVDRALRASPYLILGAGTVMALALGPGSWTRLLEMLGLVALLGAWMLWMVTLHPAWIERRPVALVYFAGLMVLIAALLTTSLWFGVLAMIGYMHAFALLRGRWVVAGMLLTSVLAATSLHGGLPRPDPADVVGYLLIVGLYLALGGLFAFTGHRTSTQNQRRKRAVAELTEANRKLEATLAENEGLHAQLLAQAREAGVLDERQRMAREIHDTLAQGLTGIIAQLEAAEQVRRSPDELGRHLDQARTLARDSLTEARRSMRALGPESLESSHLPDAVAAMARGWSATSRVPLSFATTGDVRPMPPASEVTLFRVAQEALANVAKHAAASRVGLTLSYTGDVVLLDVRDDGVGFHPAQPRTSDGGGFGLTAMRQRLDQVAGTLEVESTPGEGTSVNARIPLTPVGDGG